MVHAQTRKRELEARLSYVGVCITYDRVLRLPAQLGKTFREQFHKEQVVCPPKMRGTFLLIILTNNPSSTTSAVFFHGIGNSFLQHHAIGNKFHRLFVASRRHLYLSTLWHLRAETLWWEQQRTVLLAGTWAEDYALGSDDDENCASQSVDNMFWAAHKASHQSHAQDVVICPLLLRLKYVDLGATDVT